MTKRKEHKSRKQVYVSRAIQGRLLVRLAAYFVLYHVFLWHVLFLTQGLAFGQPGSLTERYMRFFSEHAILLLCMAAVLPIILWDILKFSHRIAGPFVRFERALQQMARGEVIQPISLRKGDLVTEFLDAFNAFIAARNLEPRVTAGPQEGRNQDACRENASATTAQNSHEDSEPAAKSYAHS